MKSINCYPVVQFLIYLAIVIGLVSCKYKIVDFDYCAVAKAHSSYVNYDRSSPTYQSDRQARHKIFRETFDEFIRYTKAEGFPVRNKVPENDTCKSLFVVSTMFIHLVQSDAEYFLSDQVRPYIVECYDKGLIENRLLLISYYSFLHNKEVCENTFNEMNSLMKDFGLYEEEFQGVKLSELARKMKTIKCDTSE